MDDRWHDESAQHAGPAGGGPPDKGSAWRRRLVTAGVLLLALLVGVALGVYAVPAGVLPGDADYRASLNTVMGAQQQLQLGVGAAIDNAGAQRPDAAIVLQGTSPAIVYTVNATSLNTCADFVATLVDGQVRHLQISQPYACQP